MEDEFINCVMGQQNLAGMKTKQTSSGVKLTNEAYKVLDFFPESDPLKYIAKEKALVIMENFILLHGDGSRAFMQKERIVSQIIEDVNVFLGYLQIGKSQRWINDSNYLIISNEYEKIKKEVKMTLRPPEADQKEGTQTAPNIVLSEEGAQNRDASSSFTVNISDRQKIILEFLSKHEKAQVMDLQAVLPDITKRTIRRDIDELLELRRISRFGEFNRVFYKIAEPTR